MLSSGRSVACLPGLCLGDDESGNVAERSVYSSVYHVHAHVPMVSRAYGITYLRYHVPTRSDERMSIASKCSWGCPYGRPERSCPFHWAARARRPAPVGLAGVCQSPPSALGAARFIGRPERGVLRQRGPAGFCPSPPSALGAARMGGPSAASCASKVQGALACNSACSWAGPSSDERPEHGIMCR